VIRLLPKHVDDNFTNSRTVFLFASSRTLGWDGVIGFARRAAGAKSNVLDRISLVGSTGNNLLATLAYR
jgi:hypothetical protein